jgi:putative ABC transport system permease protein
MNVFRIMYVALVALWHHLLRSLLTALGVIFGVGAVVGMMAVSEGARREAIREIEALGVDQIIIRSLKPEAGGSVTEEGSGRVAAEYGITARDIAHLAHFDNVGVLAPVRDLRKPIYSGGERTDVRVFGVTPEFLAVTRSRLVDPRSRFLTALDGEHFNPVCVLGVKAARRLFRFEDPVGQTLHIGAGAFRVVGLFENPYSVKLAGVYDLNNQVLVSLPAANAIFGKVAIESSAGSREQTKVEADFLYVGVRNLDQITNTAGRLRQWLATTHPRNDYEVQVPYELLKQKEAVQRRAAIVLGAIAAISLLVGGIGIMNIMMANVFERIREIGVRRALGARRRDILLQFLTESVLLTALGGLTGVALGYGLAALVSRYGGMETHVTPISVIISVTVALATGVVFGTYPALQAARVDPIQALRAE